MATTDDKNETEQASCAPEAGSASDDTTKLLTALETAIAEEAHFYRGELDSLYWVKLFRGPSFSGVTMRETLTLLAAHYAESQSGADDQRGEKPRVV